MKRYLLPLLLGFAAMFVAHMVILIGFGLGIRIPLYFIAYPVVYTLLAYLLTKYQPRWWLSNVVGILFIPFLYWYSLLWDIDRLDVRAAISFADAGGMLIILPFTLGICLLISLRLYRRKKIGTTSTKK